MFDGCCSSYYTGWSMGGVGAAGDGVPWYPCMTTDAQADGWPVIAAAVVVVVVPAWSVGGIAQDADAAGGGHRSSGVADNMRDAVFDSRRAA